MYRRLENSSARDVTIQNELDELFARARGERRTVLIPYLTAGFPRPEEYVQLAVAVFEAGADVLETFTFGGSRLKLGEYGIPDEVYAVNFTAAQLAPPSVEVASMTS